MNIKNNSSCQYLKDIAAPYMLEIYEYHKVLDHRKLLEDNFKSKGQANCIYNERYLRKAIFIENGDLDDIN